VINIVIGLIVLAIWIVTVSSVSSVSLVFWILKILGEVWFVEFAGVLRDTGMVVAKSLDSLAALSRVHVTRAVFSPI